MKKLFGILVSTSLMLLALGTWASAESFSASPWVLSILAGTGELSAGYMLNSTNIDTSKGMIIEKNGVRTWSLNSGEVISLVAADGTVVAEIDRLNVKLDSDPAVDLDFNIRNTTSSAMTVDFLSDVVTFDPIVNPVGYATAALTVTDRNLNGAQATGLFSGNKAYEARYNGEVAWADLIAPITAPKGGSNTGEDRKPGLPTIWMPINDTLSSIESEFKFTLSAKDSASGTSTFEVIPEPGSIMALGIGLMGLAGFASRRRRM